jgi:transposase-like protein
MTMIIQLPEVKRNNFMRPGTCPKCKGETFQSWGSTEKKIKDTRIRMVKVKRYRCTNCKKTFRHYPEGVSHAQQSDRLMVLCVVMWGLGLSYRSVELILSAFGVNLSHMSGWRDVQAEGRRIRRRMRWKPARVVGIDGAWLNRRGMMVAVDLGDGQLLSLAQIDEKDKAAVEQWLRSLKQKHKIGVIVTDDLSTYKELADELELGHQVCQFHVRRWVGRKVKELQEDIPPEHQEVIERVRQLIEELPKNGGKELYELWKKLPGRTTRPDEERTPSEKLRDLVLRLSRDWERYIEFYSDPGIPWTNNQTENMVGKIKNRAKRVRGYKSSNGQLIGSLVASQSWM